MKLPIASLKTVLAATLLVPLWTLAASTPATKSTAQGQAKGQAKAPADTTTSAAEIPIPKSFFKAPETARDGRNPFFPESALPELTVAKETTSPVKKAAPVVENLPLVLNGITSPPRRTAMINGRTFEQGEEGEVKLPTGSKLLVKCLEIKDESAVVDAGGVRRELRLRFAL